MVNSDKGNCASCASRNVAKTWVAISCTTGAGKPDDTVPITTRPRRSTVKLPEGSREGDGAGLEKNFTRAIIAEASSYVPEFARRTANGASRHKSQCQPARQGQRCAAVRFLR